MPTRDRGALVGQALRYFARQDYLNRELVVIDDGEQPVRDLIPPDERVRYIRLQGQRTLGEKRNFAVHESRGAIIVHWDDDDWYSADRISYQVAPILAEAAELTGLNSDLIYDIGGDEFWSLDSGLHSSFFTQDIHAGTIAYRKYLWGNPARFPATSLAEDYVFLNQAITGGARVRQLQNRGTFIYIRHGSNSWGFTCGQYVDPSSWQRREQPAFLPAEDLAFYRGVLATSSSCSRTPP